MTFHSETVSLHPENNNKGKNRRSSLVGKPNSLHSLLYFSAKYFLACRLARSSVQNLLWSPFPMALNRLGRPMTNRYNGPSHWLSVVWPNSCMQSWLLSTSPSSPSRNQWPSQRFTKVPSDTPWHPLLAVFVAKVMPPKESTRSTCPTRVLPKVNSHPTRVWGNSHVNLESNCHTRPKRERFGSVKKRPRQTKPMLRIVFTAQRYGKRGNY